MQGKCEVLRVGKLEDTSLSLCLCLYTYMSVGLSLYACSRQTKQKDSVFASLSLSLALSLSLFQTRKVVFLPNLVELKRRKQRLRVYTPRSTHSPTCVIVWCRARMMSSKTYTRCVHAVYTRWGDAGAHLRKYLLLTLTCGLICWLICGLICGATQARIRIRRCS